MEGLNNEKEDIDMNERILRKKRTGILNQIRESLVSNQDMNYLLTLFK